MANNLYAHHKPWQGHMDMAAATVSEGLCEGPSQNLAGVAKSSPQKLDGVHLTLCYQYRMQYMPHHNKCYPRLHTNCTSTLRFSFFFLREIEGIM